MSGIWDRIIPTVTPGDRVSAHELHACMHCSVYGVFTQQQLLDGLNSLVDTPLSQDAVNDLAAIRAALVALTGVNRVVGLLRFDAMNIAVEKGMLTNEATYRSQLGIS